MAEKIRLGNDIDIRWSLIDAEGNPYDLTGRDVAVEIVVADKKRVRIKDVEVSGNTAHFIYYGKDQKYTGRCDLKFIENDGVTEMVTFDTRGAFELVAHSWLIGGSPENERVQISFVTVTSEIHSAVGPQGVSIESVVQVVTSTEDQGENVVRVTLTDGEQSDFIVRNGSKGSQGIQGEKGDKGDACLMTVEGTTLFVRAYNVSVSGTTLTFS